MPRTSESSPTAGFFGELAALTGRVFIFWCVPLVALAVAPIAFILARDAAMWAIDLSAPGAWIEISVAAVVPAVLALVVRLWGERRQAWKSDLICGIAATGFLQAEQSILSVAFIGFVFGGLLADSWLAKDVQHRLRHFLDMTIRRRTQ